MAALVLKNTTPGKDTTTQSQNWIGMTCNEHGPMEGNGDSFGTIPAAETATCSHTVQVDSSEVAFSWSKSNFRDILSVLFVVLFCLFWLSKINGYFDFTGRYNIKHLYASRCSYNALLMLDNELKTNWSNKDEPHDNDYLIISFRFPQIIDKIEMFSSSSPKLRLVSWDSDSCKNKYIKYHCQHDEGSNVYVYVLEEDKAIQNIRIEVDDIGTKVPWTVEELKFDIRKSKS